MNRQITFGEFEFQTEPLQLRRRGTPVRIQDQPAQILVALLRSPGELVTREQLRKELWPDGTYVEFDTSLNTAMRKLRIALGESADNPRFISTLPKQGYQFIAPVLETSPQPASLPVPEGISLDPALVPPPRTDPKRPHWPAVLAIALLFSVIAGGLGWQLGRSSSNSCVVQAMAD